MKYFVLIPDGMADEKIELLENRTPMQAAKKPMMDTLAKKAFVGTVSNVPTGMVPESDTANMAILSFDPTIYSKGRAPLEAVSMGLEMQPDETAYRCNLVTLSEEEDYDDKRILDHSADEITTEEADALIQTLQKHLGTPTRTFHTGISYRHCLIWKNGNDHYPFMRPHDILGQRIGDYLPKAENGGADFYDLMKQSYSLLNHHPINEARRARGLKPANSAWLWSPGKKPMLPNFQKKWGVKAAMISAVDLIKGIAICAGMTSVDVAGATGNLNTNYHGKATAAIHAFENGYDYVYVHVEAPDECGHRAEAENKVLAIEQIDQKILSPVYHYLQTCGEPFRILILPDHPTPVRLRTHTSLPVPFLIYDSEVKLDGVDIFCEETAAEKKHIIANGYDLMPLLIKQR